MSLRGRPVEQTATLPGGGTVLVRVAVPDDSYVAKKELNTVDVELTVGGRIVAAVNTVLDADQSSEALELAREIVAGLESGELAPPLAISAWCGQHLADWHPGTDHSRGYSARRDLGGGVLLDLSHETDYVQWLFGPAEAVSAIVRNTGTLGIETEDVADLILRVDGGVTAACHLDYLARPAVRGGWAVCARGAVRWDLLRGTAERADGDDWRPLAETAHDANDMYIAELAAFTAAVASRTPFTVDIDAGSRAVRVAVAAQRASRERREVAIE